LTLEKETRVLTVNYYQKSAINLIFDKLTQDTQFTCTNQKFSSFAL